MPLFKAALIHVHEGESILAGGNLYILRPNQEKVLSEYLKLALESDMGVAQCEARATGMTIPSIPVKAFNDIRIPLPSIAQQRRIVEKCEELIGRAKMYESKAIQIRAEISTLFENSKS